MNTEDLRCLNCGGEGGGGSMDPDFWIECPTCEGTGLASDFAPSFDTLFCTADAPCTACHLCTCLGCGGLLSSTTGHGLDICV